MSASPCDSTVQPLCSPPTRTIAIAMGTPKLLSLNLPVLILHGEADPHPGRSIMEDLLEYIPHLQYRELSK
jgi:pimeloyl-ACP methyl ester carboxylesterase